jgi:integrase
VPAYKDPHGRWRYRFAYNGERYSGSTPKGHNTKNAAERIERQHLEKLIARSYTGTMPTVREFADQFLDYQVSRTKPLTQQQQRATLVKHVVPVLGRIKLDQIRKQHIDGLVTAWSEEHKPKTINTRLGTVRRMLSLAVEWEILPRVPKIHFLKVGKEAPRFLTDEEMTALVAAAEPQWRSMILVALRSGLRIGELRGLQWGDVDFARGVIHVRRTDPGRRTMDATNPKGNRDRIVPLTGDSRAVLQQLGPGKATAWVWPALLRRQSETRSRARSEKGCWTAITRAARRAGLSDVGWHTMRHTYASHLVMRGVPIRQIQKWLGHSSVKETEKYAHLYPEHGHAEASLLDVPLLRQTGAKTLPAGV